MLVIVMKLMAIALAMTYSIMKESEAPAWYLDFSAVLAVLFMVYETLRTLKFAKH